MMRIAKFFMKKLYQFTLIQLCPPTTMYHDWQEVITNFEGQIMYGWLKLCFFFITTEVFYLEAFVLFI
jgi:hypothetical protein